MVLAFCRCGLDFVVFVPLLVRGAVALEPCLRETVGLESRERRFNSSRFLFSGHCARTNGQH